VNSRTGIARVWRTLPARRWVRLHQGADISLVVSPVTGTLCVTGTAMRTALLRDYIRIAYHG
jgi:hypothetical protein